MSENYNTKLDDSEPIWQQNVFVLWFGVFMTGVALSEVMPFLSLYIDTLGTFSKNQLSFYFSF